MVRGVERLWNDNICLQGPVHGIYVLERGAVASSMQDIWKKFGMQDICLLRGLPGSSVKQQPAAPSQETVLIVREQTQDWLDLVGHEQLS